MKYLATVLVPAIALLFPESAFAREESERQFIDTKRSTYSSDHASRGAILISSAYRRKGYSHHQVHSARPKAPSTYSYRPVYNKRPHPQFHPQSHYQKGQKYGHSYLHRHPYRGPQSHHSYFHGSNTGHHPQSSNWDCSR